MWLSLKFQRTSNSLFIHQHLLLSSHRGLVCSVAMMKYWLKFFTPSYSHVFPSHFVVSSHWELGLPTIPIIHQFNYVNCFSQWAVKTYHTSTSLEWACALEFALLYFCHCQEKESQVSPVVCEAGQETVLAALSCSSSPTQWQPRSANGHLTQRPMSKLS